MADATSTLRVRRPTPAYHDRTDPAWTPRRPEFACAANSVSLLMPYMEPYFVRSVAAALPRLDDELKERTRAYLGQETQHQRQHQHFNRILISHYRWLRPVERAAERVYRWLGTSRSPQFNLAFSASSEAIAYAAARWAAARRSTLFDGADPAVASLFVWHLAEEVEHKSIAFDVFSATGCGRWRYVGAMLTALLLVLTFVVAGTTVMLAAERRIWYPVAWWRLTLWLLTFAFELLPMLVVSALPGFHPTQWADPLWYEVWLREFDGRTE